MILEAMSGMIAYRPPGTKAEELGWRKLHRQGDKPTDFMERLRSRNTTA